MKVNGLTVNVMDKVNRSGSTVLAMRVSGEMEKPTDTENCTTLTEISMKVTGLTIKQMATEPILTQTVRSMLVSGRTINSTGSDSRPGPMEQYMKVHTLRARRMAKENLHLLMDQSIKVNFK